VRGSAPFLSIVTPSRNRASFLSDALQSVRSQRYDGRVEHIVVDGASTDGSVELLRSSGRLRWVSEPDRGQSEALNKGFAMARGELIGWLNSDDFYLDGAFAAVAAYAAAHPRTDVIYGDCVFVEEAGRLLRSKNEHHFHRGVLLYAGCFIPTTATFLRRRLVDDGMLRLTEGLHYLMDYDLFLRMSGRGASFGWLPQELAAFRWHDANKSLDRAERLRERRAVQALQGVAVDHGALLAAREAAYRYRHLAMKLLNGSTGRQRAWRRRRGEDMRWWRQAEPSRGQGSHGVG
jgi:glycosyltransferase involved in cell wall biosynthesis